MEFFKYHGTGNDFILIKEAPKNPSLIAQKVCDRHFGIGADGLIYPEPSKIADIKFNYYNMDGSIAPMCGNGMRCFVQFLIDEKLISTHDFVVETMAGLIPVSYNKDHKEITVDLGVPEHSLSDSLVKKSIQPLTPHVLTLDKTNVTLYVTNMGTIHTMIYVEASLDIEKLGPLLSKHPFFPKETNVNFITVHDQTTQTVKTYERGVGWTLACGTGTAASALLSFHLGKTNASIKTYVPGGTLYVDVLDHVYLRGPAVMIAKGVFNLNENI